MPKLCQIIAIVNGRKTTVQSCITEIHQKVQKDALLQGLSRVYTPKDENGEKKPAESKRVQLTVKSAIGDAVKSWTSLFDIIASQDQANCQAKADVMVGDKVILPGMPVTHLLFLEKQLTDVHTFIDKLPVLDPSFDWVYDDNRGCYRTTAIEQLSTVKVQVPLIKYEATKEHPAQVDVISKDVTVGTWATTHFSGAIPADEKRKYLEKVVQLQEAIKSAREKGNQIDVNDVSVGKEIFNFILG